MLDSKRSLREPFAKEEEGHHQQLEAESQAALWEEKLEGIKDIFKNMASDQSLFEEYQDQKLNFQKSLHHNRQSPIPFLSHAPFSTSKPCFNKSLPSSCSWWYCLLSKENMIPCFANAYVPTMMGDTQQGQRTIGAKQVLNKDIFGSSLEMGVLGQTYVPIVGFSHIWFLGKFLILSWLPTIDTMMQWKPRFICNKWVPLIKEEISLKLELYKRQHLRWKIMPCGDGRKFFIQQINRKLGCNSSIYSPSFCLTLPFRQTLFKSGGPSTLLAMRKFMGTLQSVRLNPTFATAAQL